MKWFIFFSLFFVMHRSIAMDYQEDDILFNINIENMEFKELEAIVKEAQQCFMYHEKNNKITLKTRNCLREILSYTIRNTAITTLEQCLNVERLYVLNQQQKKMNATLLQLYKSNMNYNYQKAVLINERGFSMSAKQWLQETLEEIEKMFICLAEEKQYKEILEEASPVYETVLMALYDKH